MAGCGGAPAYVSSNQHLLDSLPFPAGARRVRVDSVHYNRKNCEEPVVCAGQGGYVTNALYTAPAGMDSKAIADFFVHQLAPAWSADIRPQDLPGGTQYSVDFKKDGATIGLLTGSLAPNGGKGTFLLSVDYKAHR